MYIISIVKQDKYKAIKTHINWFVYLSRSTSEFVILNTLLHNTTYWHYLGYIFRYNPLQQALARWCPNCKRTFNLNNFLVSASMLRAVRRKASYYRSTTRNGCGLPRSGDRKHALSPARITLNSTATSRTLPVVSPPCLLGAKWVRLEFPCFANLFGRLISFIRTVAVVGLLYSHH